MKHERIEFNPDVMLGKPIIKGTRLTVEQIMQELADGMTVREVLHAHPRLTDGDIAAARAFAEDYMSGPVAQQA